MSQEWVANKKNYNATAMSEEIRSNVFSFCPTIIYFWENVHQVITKNLGYNVPKSSVIFVERFVSSLLEDNHKADPPTQHDWHNTVSEIYVMELLTRKIRSQNEQCRGKWEKWFIYTMTG